MRSDEASTAGDYYIAFHYLFSDLRLEMHFLSDSVQYGTERPNVSLILVLSKTEYEGLVTGLGNSLLWHGWMSQAVVPLYSAIILVKSNQLQTPSLE